MRAKRERKPERVPFRLDILDEPNVLVGHGQVFTHPRDGLFLAGPLTTAGQPKEIEIGAIGTTVGLELFRQFCVKVRGFFAPRPKPKLGPGLHRQRLGPALRLSFLASAPKNPEQKF